MLGMPAQTEHTTVSHEHVGTLELDGIEVPYVDLNDEELVTARLQIDDTEYSYVRSYPVKGHSAVMPGDVRPLLAEGKKILVAERLERYYLYVS
jgi:hypothetical protein